MQAIQVAVSISEESVRTREIEGLIEAMEIYHLKKGTILTENEEKTIEVEGFHIQVVPIWKWLLDLSY